MAITDRTGRVTIITNGEVDWSDATDTRPTVQDKLGSIDAVTEKAEAMIKVRQSIDLASIRITSRDIVDGNAYEFGLPNGRAPSIEDERGRNIPVQSLPLGNSMLAYRAVGAIREEAEILKDFDRAAAKPKIAAEIRDRQLISIFWSLPAVRYLYDHRPRIL